MKKVSFLVCFLLSMPISESSMAQWIPQQVPSDVTMLLSIDFANITTGVASGYSAFGFNFRGRALYTRNRGEQWSLAQVPDSARSLVAIMLLNDTTGYIAGAYNIPGRAQKPFAGRGTPNPFVITDTRSISRSCLARIGMVADSPPYKGYFLKSTNQGQLWFPYGSLPDSTSYLTGAFFLNERIGFASASHQDSVTSFALILKTTNGGLGWSKFIPPVRIVSLRNICFADELHGIVVGSRDSGLTSVGVIMLTEDGGDTWAIQDCPFVSGLQDVYFPNTNTCYVVGTNSELHPVLVNTTNGGITWEQHVFPDTALGMGIRFAPGTSTGIVLGDRLEYDTLGFYTSAGIYIMRTTDGGTTWMSQTGEGAPIHGVTIASELLSPLEGYIAGGTITTMAYVFHTTNGGLTFVGPDDRTKPNDFRLYQNYPNPFNPSTTIEFSVPQTGYVSLRVFDVLGKEVATLLSEQMQSGKYRTQWNAPGVASGVYYYRLQVDGFAQSRQLVLLK